MNETLLLWDIDGTLMHCGSNGTKALNETFEQLYQIKEAFKQIKIGTAMDSMILEKMMSYFSLDPKEKNKILGVYEKKLKQILEENPNKKILEGVREILEWTKNQPHLYHAILTSNFKIGADLKLESVGLAENFRFGGYGDIYGEKWNAALDAISQVENAYGGLCFSKSNIYFIGDTCYDIKCAKKIGVKSISIATGWTDYKLLEEAKPDYLFYDLKNWKDFLKVIKQL